jgi:hypothetical protein
MTLDLQTTQFASTLLNNTDELVATLVGATGTTLYGPLYNPKNAIRLSINISAITAGSLVVNLLGYDNASGATWLVLASAALATTGLTRMTVSFSIPASANVYAFDYPPVYYQVQAVVTTGPVWATIGSQCIGS